MIIYSMWSLSLIVFCAVLFIGTMLWIFLRMSDNEPRVVHKEKDDVVYIVHQTRWDKSGMDRVDLGFKVFRSQGDALLYCDSKREENPDDYVWIDEVEVYDSRIVDGKIEE